jgi:Rrf2 family protein
LLLVLDARPPSGNAARDLQTTGSGRIIPNPPMKISKRGEYALRAMIDLGIAAELGHPMLRAQEIVARENLPKGFLDQILMQLRKAGYIGTKRGKHGGYFLDKPMDSITLGQVVRLVDGPLAPIRCVSQSKYEKCSCPDENTCGLRMVMLDVRNSIADILDRHTLAETVRKSLAKMRACGVKLPHQSKGSAD